MECQKDIETSPSWEDDKRANTVFLLLYTVLGGERELLQPVLATTLPRALKT